MDLWLCHRKVTMDIRDFIEKVERCAFVASRQREKTEEQLRCFVRREIETSFGKEGFDLSPIVEFTMSITPLVGSSRQTEVFDDLKVEWASSGRDAWDYYRYIEMMSTSPSEADLHPGAPVIDRTIPRVFP